MKKVKIFQLSGTYGMVLNWEDAEGFLHLTENLGKKGSQFLLPSCYEYTIITPNIFLSCLFFFTVLAEQPRLSKLNNDN